MKPTSILRLAWTSGALILAGQANAYDCSNLTLWSEQQVYRQGDITQSQNQAYEAKWYSQNDNPAGHSGPYDVWRSLGACATGSGQTPSVVLTSPNNGAVLGENDSAVFSANANDADGDLAYVEFLVNGQVIATDTSAPFQTTWSAVLGEYDISAIATDLQGLTGSSQSARITVKPGGGNLPPNVSIVAPANGQQFYQGDMVRISITAEDSDGTIAGVEISLNNQLVANLTTSPFEFQFQAEQVGVNQLNVKAIDNQGLVSEANLAIDVLTKVGGGCQGLRAYSAGQNYQTGELVAHNNHKYRCDIAGWCSSNAQWAYEPGTGQYWTDAWSDLGICAIAPTVTFESPSNNGTVLVNAPTTISVSAQDTDGSIATLSLYADNTLLATANQGTLSHSWTPTTLNPVSLNAIAVDNESNQSEQTITVNVTDKPIAVDLLAPTSGSQITLGNSTQLIAQASSFVGQITQVQFYADGVLLNTDATPPYEYSYAPASIGTKTLYATATNDNNDQVSSSGVTVQVIDKPIGKKHKLIGYWHNFVNPAGCPIPLDQMSTAWDIIDIAFAENDRNSNGTVHFTPFEKDIRSNCPPIDPVKFKSDMQALQAQGKVFVLSLGGAEGTITLNTDADEAAFVSSLTGIIQQWGFDGLDIDLESGSNLVHGSQIQARLPRALKQIEQNIGGNMVLTMAPEHPYVHGGMIAYSGIWGAYIPLINELRDTLDLLHVQLYNNGGLPNPYEPGSAPEGSVNMMVAHAKMLIEGFDLADGTRFAPLRDDQVAIGLPSGPQSANSGQAPIGNIINALDCLTKGTGCGTIQPNRAYPNFGGVMTWSINWDKYDGYNFSQPIGDKLTQMNRGN
ncbi:chitinase [Pseudoalteromonas piscicida]|uniref:chitinase n=1 Tax=Pseudoalteromonas piscicida TaxID=43662 RepID=A0AAQ2EYS8_PSEO7|nr:MULTISPECIES: Ig-like domain-containing protein [Pseudoalteromonas]KJY92445.1 chitinase [Pseudoalteromonas piscicida]TMN38255.1 chitinase [Pseudoalteromonas piscicida]TMN39474.1 chitinase [Pseudoalteromonas piscicida]TMN50247.1 chitinase [Pseudoalteromonas piscicida]TMN52465.1 chitinase [Pseudoalteromonas piscicida]